MLLLVAELGGVDGLVGGGHFRRRLLDDLRDVLAGVLDVLLGALLDGHGVLVVALELLDDGALRIVLALDLVALAGQVLDAASLALDALLQLLVHLEQLGDLAGQGADVLRAVEALLELGLEHVDATGELAHALDALDLLLRALRQLRLELRSVERGGVELRGGVLCVALGGVDDACGHGCVDIVDARRLHVANHLQRVANEVREVETALVGLLVLLGLRGDVVDRRVHAVLDAVRRVGD